MRHHFVTVVILALLGVSCAPTQTATLDDSTSIPVGDYVLAAIEGDAIDTALPESARQPTLSLDRSGGARGVTGINRYSTLVDPELYAGGAYRFGTIVTSRAAGPPDAMAFERRFLALLERVGAYSIEPGALVLRDADGRELLRFTPAD